MRSKRVFIVHICSYPQRQKQTNTGQINKVILKFNRLLL